MQFRFKQPLVGEGALRNEPKQQLQRRLGESRICFSFLTFNELGFLLIFSAIEV